MAHDLRPATPEDVSAIEAVVRAAYAHYVPRIGREPGPMLDDYAGLVRQGQVNVATRGGTVEGVLVLTFERDALLLGNMAVAPAAQGQGLGRRLMTFAEEVAREAGLPVVRLFTNEAMTENLAIYARLGFRETHRAEDKGFRRVYMSKALA